MEQSEISNTSGQGKAMPLPPGIIKWNWGAFAFGWLWGLFNRTWIALLTLIPVVNIVMVFVLGAKGSEWAWRNKHWDSVEHFRRVQRKWAMAGAILLVVTILGFMAALGGSQGG